MIFIVLLDNKQYITIDPNKLTLRQVKPGVSALGFIAQQPVFQEGTNIPQVVDGKPVMEETFQSFISFPVDLVEPTAPVEAPKETPDVQANG